MLFSLLATVYYILIVKLLLYFRLPSQDQIVYVAQNNSIRKDLMLNHTFEVIFTIVGNDPKISIPIHRCQMVLSV
jgi:hypothetical protein